MTLDVVGKTRAAVAALMDLAAEIDAAEGYTTDARDIREYAEQLEYKYAPDFGEDSQ